MVWEDYLYIITANGVDDTHKHVVAPQAPSIICFQKSTGQVVWKDNSPGKAILHSQWSNPTLAEADGRTLVIAPLGDSWIYAFDARTGQIVWTFDGNPKDSVYPATRNEIIATPVVVGRKMYIAMGQDPEHGEGYGRLWCVDITGTGDVSAELPADPGRPGPRLGDAFRPPGRPNPNSKVIWQYEKFDLNHDGKFDRGEHMNRTLSSAAIDPATNLLFIPDFSGFLHCLDAATGQIYWTHDLESAIWSTPLVCDGKVYVSDEDGEVVIFKTSKEKRVLAKNETGATIHSAPIFANGVLFVATREKLLAVREVP
jgi:outer membrane protein assembly factor BamB